ncbi:hypothetical protein MLOOGBEN_28840 [Bacillus sp. EB106-08-02-XG196]|uniref:CHAT domain-containing protein n=1 Tax=Bacillus sp. EB106-08-02-XG196 TaxID=2737049 RepID=UPI0015C42E87|nr:CHAT domain-containing protein [Bacillus sp. EB106-08-02-XG196]NWQ44687.1 hypothetical protein [Bacillus sp. EB106-08-02-XG196]
MGLLDSCRSNIVRKKNELTKLQSDRANETKKISTQTNKILNAKKAMQRTKSITTIKSKYREIERVESTLAAIDKKVAEIDRKIAKKEAEIMAEEKKLNLESDREQKKRNADEKKRIAENEKRMKEVSGMLERHSKMHQEANKTLEELKNLPEKITVLFIASNPLNAPQLRLDEEAREIQEMIRKSEHRDSVLFKTRWATRSLDLLQAINEEEPTVIHFSGHGSENDEIVFQDNQGNAKFVSKEAIVQTIMSASDNIKLIFFNTCFSYAQAQALTIHVEAAIGMTTSIGDDAARVFAAQFYSAIGFGLSIKKAFEQGKAALMLEGISEEDTPELFVKEGLNPDELIIVKP